MVGDTEGLKASEGGREDRYGGPEVEAARRGALALLDGEGQSGVTAEECGRWWRVVEGLEIAYRAGGTLRVRQVFDRLVEVSPEISEVFAWEPKLPDSSVGCPPLPEEARSIFRKGEACGEWLDEYICFAAQAAPMTPRSFHEAAGLFLASIAIGRRLVFYKGLIPFYPNLYFLWIAPTTLYRKSSGVGVVQKVARWAGLQDTLLAEETTPAALLQEMSTQLPSSYGRWNVAQRDAWLRQRGMASQRALLVDEAAGLFDAMQRGQRVNLLTLLLRLYDCPEELSEQTVNRGRQVVERPWLSFFGISTPVGMEAHLRDRNLWANGLWRRFVLVVPDAEPVWQSGTGEAAYPRRVVGRLEAMRRMFPVPKARIVRNWGDKYVLIEGGVEPSRARLAAGVEQAWETYAKATGHDMLREGQIDELLHGCYGNLGALAIKVAMLLAAMDTRKRPVQVELRHLQRAVEIVEGWRASLHRVSASGLQAKEVRTGERVLRALEEAGAAGLTARGLCYRLHLPAREIQEALRGLERAGQVRMRNTRASNGRRMEVWTTKG